MNELLDKKKIRQVYRNVQKHQRTEALIRQFSSNKEDIRLTSLKTLDLMHCQNVLELGCAFGSFTDALKNQLHPQAHITGLDIVAEYEPFFLQACGRAGYSGTFSSAGVHQIKKYPAESFDLVICSFALYFFIGIIPDIARILKPDGVFITITHSEKNMQELISITRSILKNNRLLDEYETLPIEIILQQFSTENGKSLLTPYFTRIEHVYFHNSLIFQTHEIESLMEYYQFKKPFFLTTINANKKNILDQLLSEMRMLATRENILNMCKDDSIFICGKNSLPEGGK